MIDQVKSEIKEKLELKFKIANIFIETAKRGNADLAIPLFSCSKELGIKVDELYLLFRDYLLTFKMIKNITFLSGFLNIYLNRLLISEPLLKEIYLQKNHYGQKSTNKVVVIDYSSPNIAKHFSVGHLRSTVIGNSLKKIYSKMGYKVIGINHLGDWGTQFGKLIIAYKRWSSKEELLLNPVAVLQKLYVRFHEEAKNDLSLENDAREAFKMLEDQNSEYLELWKWFKEESLKEFMEMYQLLGVTFESYDGESFYNDKMTAVIARLHDLNYLKEDQGATIVTFSNMPPALIKRSDGATLYITRDLAALIYRYQTYHFDKILYVVGGEQKLHFEQLKAISDLLGYNFDISHVNFGLVLYDGKKMSTREGKFAKLKDVLDDAVLLAKNAISTKSKDLKNSDKISKAVGIGAVVFNDLKNERHLDIDFNLDNMLQFEGQTGPYIQYSSVRISSILKNHVIDLKEVSYQVYEDDEYFGLVKLLDQFLNTIKKAMELNAPSIIARYLLLLASEFNHFYGNVKIVVSDTSLLNSNLLLINAIREVLNEGLSLLGIEVLYEM